MSFCTGTATAVGGRNGHVDSSNGVPSFELSVPEGMDNMPVTLEVV